MDAKGEVVTFDTLVVNVWKDKDVTFHTVTQTANDLKRCLSEYGDCIQNQHGVGYYFQAPPSVPRREAIADLDLDALTDYGLGLEELHRRTESSLQRALVNFRRVVDRYPECVPALLGVADCLILLGHAGFPVFRPEQVLPEARTVVSKALKLAIETEHKAAAITALAKIQLIYDWEWSKAEDNFYKARTLNPSYAPIYHGLGHLFLITHRFDESLEAIRQARRLAPSSPMLHGTYGWFLYFMGQYKKAIEQCHKTTALHPQFPAGHVMLALAYEADGLYREALDAFHTSYDLQPSPIALSGIGHVYGRMGKKPSAERVLKQLKVMSNSGQTAMSQYFYGLVYAGLGDTGEALSCLQQAYRERFDWMAYLPVDPRWDVLHNESRFKELLRKLGLYDFWQRKAN